MSPAALIVASLVGAALTLIGHYLGSSARAAPPAPGGSGPAPPAPAADPFAGLPLGRAGHPFLNGLNSALHTQTAQEFEREALAGVAQVLAPYFLGAALPTQRPAAK